MDLSLPFYVIAILSVLMTGLSKSGFGGGLGVMAVPMMSLFVSPQFAAAVLMPILLAMDVLIVWRYRRSWDRRIVSILLPAACAGLVLGALAFQYTDADLVRLCIGLLAAVFVLQFLVSRRLPGTTIVTPRPIIYVLGLLSGFASFVAHAGGPPVKGYLLKQKLEKSRFVGTNTVFFFSLNFLKSIAYGATGTLTADSIIVSAWLSPCVVLGVYLGTRLHAVIDQEVFVKVVYAALALTSVKLLSDGIAAFLA